MLTSPQKGSDGSSTTARDEELALGTIATPDDYLEKVFQIPFWIRPLAPSACKNLVNALTKDDVESQSDATGRKTSGNSRGVERGEQRGVSSTSTGAETVAKPEASPKSGDSPVQHIGATDAKPLAEVVAFNWSVIEPKPRTLQLTKAEQEYMIELAPVIGRSPRSVKRFVNCYRLLKSALDKEDLAQATRGENFRTTMFLLGMVTGLPDIAPALLADLRQTGKTLESWADLAAKRVELHKRETDLREAIELLKGVSKRSTIDLLVKAADLVDRFSFSPVRKA
jgi:hypothetical protein